MGKKSPSKSKPGTSILGRYGVWGNKTSIALCTVIFMIGATAIGMLYFKDDSAAVSLL